MLSLYGAILNLIEPMSFDELFALNFYMQKLPKKQRTEMAIGSAQQGQELDHPFGCAGRIFVHSQLLSVSPVVPLRDCDLHHSMAGRALRPIAAPKVQPFKAALFIRAL
jgi:hypothetical protein